MAEQTPIAVLSLPTLVLGKLRRNNIFTVKELETARRDGWLKNLTAFGKVCMASIDEALAKHQAAADSTGRG